MTDMIIATRFHGVIMSYLLNEPVLGETSKMPRVSIGVPVYNGERYVAETLDSLLAQTFEDFELTICDNASTDRTEQICRTYAERDARISYVRHAENRRRKRDAVFPGALVRLLPGRDDPVNPAGAKTGLFALAKVHQPAQQDEIDS